MQIGDFFGFSNVSGSTLVGTSGSIQILDINPGRIKVIVQSHSIDTWFIKLGPNCSTTDFTVKISSGSRYVFTTPGLHSGTISAVQEGADGLLMITEFSKLELNY